MWGNSIYNFKLELSKSNLANRLFEIDYLVAILDPCHSEFLRRLTHQGINGFIGRHNLEGILDIIFLD